MGRELPLPSVTVEDQSMVRTLGQVGKRRSRTLQGLLDANWPVGEPVYGFWGPYPLTVEQWTRLEQNKGHTKVKKN